MRICRAILVAGVLFAAAGRVGAQSTFATLTGTVTDPTVGVDETFTVASGLDHLINVNDFVIPADATDPFVNTAKATCGFEKFPNVYTKEASWSIELFQPSINLTKSAEALSKAGDRGEVPGGKLARRVAVPPPQPPKFPSWFHNCP